MSQAGLTTMTEEEYLAWEAKQELKWEFDGLKPVPMNGDTVGHNIVHGNLSAALNVALRGKACTPCGPDMKVPTPKGSYRYPDLLVTCTPHRLDETFIADPVVIFEVLSDSTSRSDRTEKLVEYRSLPSLRRYVMLEQDQCLATVITRTGETWSIDVLREGDTLAMPEIGADVALDDIYAGLDLPPMVFGSAPAPA